MTGLSWRTVERIGWYDAAGGLDCRLRWRHLGGALEVQTLLAAQRLLQAMTCPLRRLITHRVIQLSMNSLGLITSQVSTSNISNRRIPLRHDNGPAPSRLQDIPVRHTFLLTQTVGFVVALVLPERAEVEEDGVFL